MTTHSTKLQGPLVVEFVGMPGSGKTTVAKRVASLLFNAGQRCFTREDMNKAYLQRNRLLRLLELAPTSLRRWRLLQQALLYTFRVRPLAGERFRRALKILRVNGMLESNADFEVILLDQGILQEIASIAVQGEPPGERYLRQLLARLPPDRLTVVFFELDVDTALSRIRRRSKSTSRFDQWDAAYSRQQLLEYQGYLQSIIACVQALGLPVLRIDGNCPMNANARAVFEWLGENGKGGYGVEWP